MQTLAGCSFVRPTTLGAQPPRVREANRGRLQRRVVRRQPNVTHGLLFLSQRYSSLLIQPTAERIAIPHLVRSLPHSSRISPPSAAAIWTGLLRYGLNLQPHFGPRPLNTRAVTLWAPAPIGTAHSSP